MSALFSAKNLEAQGGGLLDLSLGLALLKKRKKPKVWQGLAQDKRSTNGSCVKNCF